jgi:hypothetical protein
MKGKEKSLAQGRPAYWRCQSFIVLNGPAPRDISTTALHSAAGRQRLEAKPVMPPPWLIVMTDELPQR